MSYIISLFFQNVNTNYQFFLYFYTFFIYILYFFFYIFQDFSTILHNFNPLFLYIFPFLLDFVKRTVLQNEHETETFLEIFNKNFTFSSYCVYNDDGFLYSK